MADEPEDDVLPAEVEDETPEEQPEQQAEQSDDDELEVTFGDEAPPPEQERETNLAKHLREEIKRRDKELAELRRAAPQQQVEVGNKPDLWEDCEGDPDKYDAAMDDWRERKATVERQQSETTQSQRQAQEAWAEEVKGFEEKRAAIKSPKAQEAIETAIASLTPVQQAVIVKASDNPANVLCALGMYPAKLAEITAIADPLKQAVAIAKMEGKLQVTNRKRAPDPEEIATGNASVKGSDAALEKLQKQADKTGDRTELIRYRKQLSAKAKS